MRLQNTVTQMILYGYPLSTSCSLETIVGWIQLYLLFQRENLPSTLKYDGGTKTTGVVFDVTLLTFDDVRVSNNVFNEPVIAISIRNLLILSLAILQNSYP